MEAVSEPLLLLAGEVTGGGRYPGTGDLVAMNTSDKCVGLPQGFTTKGLKPKIAATLLTWAVSKYMHKIGKLCEYCASLKLTLNLHVTKNRPVLSAW